jgi:hypothetical protein
VFVNDAYLGLYMLIEPIDKTFLARAFGTGPDGKAENGGYLYEYAWKDAYQWDYLGSSLQIYAELFEPKTRETEAPSLLYGPLEDFFRTLNEVDDTGFESLDLRTFVRHLAVENFIAERDGVLGYWGPNNFYAYRFQGRKQMQLIAWDKDLAFWAKDYDIFQGVEDNVLARRALAIPGLRRVYLETLLACAATAMAPESPDSPIGCRRRGQGEALFERAVRRRTREGPGVCEDTRTIRGEGGTEGPDRELAVSVEKALAGSSTSALSHVELCSTADSWGLRNPL